MRTTGGLAPTAGFAMVQGGIGGSVSSWKLAKAGSRAGQLGVVSGVTSGPMAARQLCDGDRAGAACMVPPRLPPPRLLAPGGPAGIPLSRRAHRALCFGRRREDRHGPPQVLMQRADGERWAATSAGRRTWKPTPTGGRRPASHGCTGGIGAAPAHRGEHCRVPP